MAHAIEPLAESGRAVSPPSCCWPAMCVSYAAQFAPTECRIHRLRLKVACTKKCLHKGLVTSPQCSLCGVWEDIEHAFCVCPHFLARMTARSSLWAKNLTMKDFLGPWNSKDNAVRDVKTLVHFPRDWTRRQLVTASLAIFFLVSVI